MKFESRILHKETLQTPRFAGFFVVCPESFAFVASLAAGHLPPFLPAGSFPAAVRRTGGGMSHADSGPSRAKDGPGYVPASGAMSPKNRYLC